MGFVVLVAVQLVGLFLCARSLGHPWLFGLALAAVVSAFVLIKRKQHFQIVNWAVWGAALFGIGAAVAGR